VNSQHISVVRQDARIFCLLLAVSDRLRLGVLDQFIRFFDYQWNPLASRGTLQERRWLTKGVELVDCRRIGSNMEPLVERHSNFYLSLFAILFLVCPCIASGQIQLLPVPAPDNSTAVTLSPVTSGFAPTITSASPTMSWQYYAFGGPFTFGGGQTSGTFVANGGVGGTFVGGSFQLYFNIIADSTSITFDYSTYNGIGGSAPSWSASDVSLPPTIHNGLAINALSGLTIHSVKIDPATNMVGFDPSRISFTSSQIQVDWQNLPFNTGTIVKLDINGNGSCSTIVKAKWGQCQGKPGPWGGDQYNSDVGTTMCSEGCATTALAMALNSAGVVSLPKDSTGFINIDPGSLNVFMTSTPNDYDDDHNVSFVTTTLDVSGATLAQRAGKQLHFDDSLSGSSSLSDLKDKVCQGHPIIVAVPPVAKCIVLPGPIGGHFVLVTGEHDDSAGNPHFDIDDPGCATITSLDAYSNAFKIRGFVADPSDVSTLEVSVGNNADVLVTDLSGNQTGFDPVTSIIKKDIPRSSYSRDFLTDNDTGQQSTGITHSVDIFQPTQGTYNVTVLGIQLGTYRLLVSPFSTDGSPQPRPNVTGIAAPGSTTSFQIQFVPSSGSISTITRAASFQGTLDDIKNSVLIGLIDNEGIGNSLSQKIRNAANATGQARINILRAFIKEINAQAGQHINGAAIDVLLSDANSLIADKSTS
jgi:Peptidase_C39 like family